MQTVYEMYININSIEIVYKFRAGSPPVPRLGAGTVAPPCSETGPGLGRVLGSRCARRTGPPRGARLPFGARPPRDCGFLGRGG